MFVFELADCGLDKVLQTQFGKLKQFLWDAAQNLAHMHMNRVAYCDLKVDNMLIVGGRLKFSDFDTSILLDEQPLQII